MLDISKVLNDLRDIARETAESHSEQKFDRRKLAVDPENLKALDVKPIETTEAYTIAGGYRRVCKTKANGKKQLYEQSHVGWVRR